MDVLHFSPLKRRVFLEKILPGKTILSSGESQTKHLFGWSLVVYNIELLNDWTLSTFIHFESILDDGWKQLLKKTRFKKRQTSAPGKYIVLCNIHQLLFSSLALVKQAFADEGITLVCAEDFPEVFIHAIARQLEAEAVLQTTALNKHMYSLQCELSDAAILAFDLESVVSNVIARL